MFDIVKSIFAFSIGTITVSGLLIAAMVYIVRAAFDKWMEKGVEEYKLKLSFEAEQYKRILLEESKRNEIKFFKLHNERAEIMKNLYYKVVDVKNLTDKFYRYLTQDNIEDNVVNTMSNDLNRKCEELRSFAHCNAIFFEKHLHTQIQTLIDSFFIMNLASIANEKKGASTSILVDLYKEDDVIKGLDSFSKTVVQKLKEYIEDEFRKILGLNNDDIKEKSLLEVIELKEN